MKQISSMQNLKIQMVRALISRSTERCAQHAFVLEGIRLVEEALNSANSPKLLFFSDQLSERGLELVDKCRQNGVEVQQTTQAILQAVSDTETSQGLIAIMPILPQAIPAHFDFALILDEVRDPGNLGAILRTAAAAGVQVVFLTPGTADAYSPKVLRSAMGAHFYLVLQELDWVQIEAACKIHSQPSLKILLASAGRGKSCWQADLDQPLALLVGNEAFGVSPQAQSLCDEYVHIPMPGATESLNASVAASILIYEVVRQRST